MASIEAGIALNSYLAINMKKLELKNSLIKENYPQLLLQKAEKKSILLCKKDCIINMIDNIENKC